jgi:hypothetical protein
MLVTLRVLLGVLGVSAILIALSIFVLGAQSTSWSVEQVFSAIARWHGPLSEPWPASMDSELRFYAPFWGAYGLILLSVARAPAGRMAWIPWLAGVFFAGGVGRLISYVLVGPPHPFFILLMAIELVMPPVFILLWVGARRAPA